jgi:hypothetical protein
MTRLFWGAGALVIIGALTAGIMLWNPGGADYAEAETIAEGATDFKELSKRFQTLAEDKGGIYAYEVLKRANIPPNTDLHLLGHIVGDELYKQEGFGGMAYCTPDFRNACSHTIAVGALNEFGEGILPKIREACKKAPGGTGAYTMCFHGFGHGVFAYYDFDIEKTVAYCKQAGTKEYNNREYIECVGGMIMELTGGGGHDPDGLGRAQEKYLTSSLAPCMSDLIPDEAKTICLTYLTPRIWQSVGIDLGRPDPDKFDEAFAACDAIPGSMQQLRDACSGGFGKEFTVLAAARDVRDMSRMNDAQLQTVWDWCMKAPRSDGESACRTQAFSSLYWGGENDPTLSVRFCSLAPATQRTPCFQQLFGESKFYLRDQAVKANICAIVPDDQKTACKAALSV